VDARGRAVACEGARGGADAVAVELRGPGGAVVRCACPGCSALFAWLCVPLDVDVTATLRLAVVPRAGAAGRLAGASCTRCGDACGGCSSFVRQHDRRGSCEDAAAEAGRAAGASLQQGRAARAGGRSATSAAASSASSSTTSGARASRRWRMRRALPRPCRRSGGPPLPVGMPVTRRPCGLG
jgi:hypothetical protein